MGCFSLSLGKERFIKPYKWYIAPCDSRLKRRKGRKKYFFSKTPKKRGNENMLRDIESLMALPPPNLSDS